MVRKAKFGKRNLVREEQAGHREEDNLQDSSFAEGVVDWEEKVG